MYPPFVNFCFIHSIGSFVRFFFGCVPRINQLLRFVHLICMKTFQLTLYFFDNWQWMGMKSREAFFFVLSMIRIHDFGHTYYLRFSFLIDKFVNRANEWMTWFDWIIDGKSCRLERLGIHPCTHFSKFPLPWNQFNKLSHTILYRMFYLFQ